MQVSRKEPGLIVSAAAHVSLLAATLIAFNSTAKFEDAKEAIPVEMITDQAFSQISKGEKTAKEAKPVQKADKVADVEELKPTPPIAEAKKDVPLPPPPLKRQRDPGEDDAQKPEPQKTAALPPPRPPMEETKPAPEPPKRPEPPKAQAKSEPKAEKQEEKDEPEEAETVAPKPPQRPKMETKQEPKPEPKQEAKQETKPVPTPPKPPEKPRLKTDEVAKLLAKSKTDDKQEKAAVKPKSGEESDDKRTKFDTNAISRMLDHDKPQATGSRGREVVRTASLGTATGTSQRVAPNMMDALNSLMMEQWMRCWHYFGTSGGKYFPQISLKFRPDGSLAAEPVLRNPTSDPAFESLAKAAMSAVRECNPMKIPAQFAPYYEQWKTRTVEFRPDEMR